MTICTTQASAIESVGENEEVKQSLPRKHIIACLTATFIPLCENKLHNSFKKESSGF